jgi:2-(1,2-epoxy-1,2-dihydrophenyl)acetyl-CoA isomerase
MEARNGYQVFSELFRALWEIELPVVSAVNGTVAGVGWLLALLADIVVADEHAKWIHVFIRRGMVPHAGDPFYLSRMIPFHRLAELALLSDPVESSVLHEWGVVNRSVPGAEVLPCAEGLAARLAQGPTLSLGVTKQLYRRALVADRSTALTDENASVALIGTTRDRIEGVAAFLEGRDITFLGE